MNRNSLSDHSGDFHLLAASKQLDILDKIVDVAKHYPMRMCRLTPVKGILGSENLNLKLQEVSIPDAEKAELAFGSPCRVIRRCANKNDYQLFTKIVRSNASKEAKAFLTAKSGLSEW